VIVLQADDIDRSRRTELLIEDAVWTPGDTFRLGSDDHYPEEAPSHHVTLEGFWIDRTPVTNRRFNPFVNATRHATAAEFSPRAGVKDLRDVSQCWTFMRGANWRHPYGSKSSIKALDDDPVVHVSYSDALANAKYRNSRRPG
jgi:formylglycine-generating enzyme